jgi:dinuclear metal center YbgI/SA1388 family protein
VPTLDDVTQVVERLWPLAGAESWDASGLLSGDPDAPVTRIRLAVDAVRATAEEAVSTGADLLIVHHPLLLRGVTTVRADRYKGAVLSTLIRGGCALVAAHTNADVVDSGTSGVIAASLGLVDVRPITTRPGVAGGLGRVGRMPDPLTLGRLARSLAALLPPTAQGVRVAGGFDDVVSSVAVCGGAGDSLLSEPSVLAADVYITSDLRHHPASEARENARLGGGPALIDVAHWASEWLWLETAAAQLRAELPGVEVDVSELRTDPWDFAVMQ